MDREYISKNIDEILHMCLGKDASQDDCNSYETLLNFLSSDRYEFRSVEQLEKIKEWLFDNTDLLREATDKVINDAKQLFNNTVAVLSIVLITAIIVFVLDFTFESINKYGVNKIKQDIVNSSSNNTEEDNTASDNSVQDETQNNEENEQDSNSAENNIAE